MTRRIGRFLAVLVALALGAAALMRVPAVACGGRRDRAYGRLRSRTSSSRRTRCVLAGRRRPAASDARASRSSRRTLGRRYGSSWNRLAPARRRARIGGILFTHFHSDHIGDLGEFDLNTWGMGRPGPLRVFGPPGVERVVAGFEESYALDTQYRIAHHGPEFFSEASGVLEPHPIAGPAAGGGPEVFLDEDGLRITAFAVHHDPVKPAYGYRFDYGGRSVVVSGDTTKDARLVAATRGADVLFHEAQANHLVAQIGEAAANAGRPRVAKIMHDIPSYHTSPVEAAEVANEAGVKLLVMYHLTPPPPVRVAEWVFTRGVSDVRSDGWLLANDGLLVELPVDSSVVTTRELH
jgi:ribonuclease Z